MLKITPLDIIGKSVKGYTYEYFHERMGRHLILFRKAGSISGNHYHKGLSLNKNPEILILLSGVLSLSYKEVQSAQIQSIQLSEPTQIEIPPYMWHEIYCHSDCTLIELCSISEHEADTFTDM